MNKGFILGFFIRLYAFLCNAYQHSLFKKICDGAVNIIRKITKNSFFVNFFSAPSEESRTSSSGISKVTWKILKFLRKLLLKLLSPVKNSGIVQALGIFYHNILHYSVKYWGIFAMSAVVSYSAVSIIWRSMTNTKSVVAVIILIISAIFCASDTSVYNFFTNSVFVKIFGKLLGKDRFEYKDTIGLSYGGAFFTGVAGVVFAAVCVFTDTVFPAVFLLGVLAAGWIIYDYTIGVFIAAVILPFSPTMALVALIMLTFVSFVLRFVFDESMKFRRTPLDIPILFFAGILIISAVTSFDIRSSIMATLVYIAFILSYYLMTNSIFMKKRLFSLVALMLFAGLFVGAYGIYQHIFGFAEGTTWIDEDMFSDIATRVVSTFENPNVLGEYLLLLIPVGLAVVWGAKKGRNKLIHLCIVGVLSLCMIYTYSRGNWIGLLIAVFMFFMFYDRRFIWLGVIALLLSPMFLPQNVLNRFLSVGDMGDTSTSYRVYIWMGTLNMLRDYWFSGIGIGTEAFNKIYPMYAYSGVIAPHSHNLYLQIITENGIMGLVIFISMLVIYFKMCISTIITCKDRLLKALTTGLAAGMFGYLVQGMFDNVWYNYRVFLLFFIILGITSVCTSICKSSTEVEKC